MDLVKEREAFVRSFLRKGVEYTEALLEESRELRSEIADLRAENARLRAQIASDDAIKDLLKTIERLEKERGNLLERSEQLEQTEQERRDRQAAVEQEINDLANLYVANFQLHASFSPRRVIRHLSDMAGQLVGAAQYVVYLVDAEGKRAYPVASDGLDEAEVQPVEVGDASPVGEACLTGIARVREADLEKATREDPAAVIPVMADGKAVGVVEVITLLEQKEGWANVDHELFQLLGSQAGVALIAANLYDAEAGPLAALRGIEEKL
ncbi:MAG: hypothetical protein CMN31_10890 [Sandaracinus sp.]|nr:hypothetical protein [Sandaracinus sp.]MBJ71828.1 hypothetical protein [Sandaracinus sp.]HJK91314.1 GAF domain-containing protein [Polyangiaceae bacterium LLY-WYZ-15_(1-7)]HJL28947.1 GAF domain-containing protein [Polyangiaceae bacterium LLY-WYZ-15_(1-7)]HJL49697.1 GAF domain-containing protein [Polyangiaceae bacterium LLY-WYZ-15_(1-7)]